MDVICNQQILLQRTLGVEGLLDHAHHPRCVSVNRISVNLNAQARPLWHRDVPAYWHQRVYEQVALQ